MGRGRSAAVNVTEIAAVAASMALEQYKLKERQEARNAKLHNTELLLKKYKSLVAHVGNAIEDIKAIKAEDILLDEDELYINSIRKSKTKTLIMIAHIEAAIDYLEKTFRESGHPEKARLIKALYIDDETKTFEQIAEELYASERTLRRWKNEAIEELSVLIFGVDGLRLSV